MTKFHRVYYAIDWYNEEWKDDTYRPIVTIDFGPPELNSDTFTPKFPDWQIAIVQAAIREHRCLSGYIREHRCLSGYKTGIQYRVTRHTDITEEVTRTIYDELWVE